MIQQFLRLIRRTAPKKIKPVKTKPTLLHAYLNREIRSNKHTLSVLTVADRIFQVIEPPWKNNERNISCIPAGTYLCKFLKQSASGKYKNCYHLQDVENRTGILIHNGNLVKHTKGCLIIGTTRGFLSGKRAVLSSKVALNALSTVTDKKDFYLTIFGG